MNIQQIMKQAQQMQKKMQENQANLEKQEFDGSAGNGLVTIKLLGTGFVKKISIDNSVVIVEEKDVLEDLVMAAFNDAKQKLDKAAESSVSGATGGMNLKNMKLPF